MRAAAFAGAAALIAGAAAAPAPQDISVVNNAKVTNTLTTTYTKVSLFMPCLYNRLELHTNTYYRRRLSRKPLSALPQQPKPSQPQTRLSRLSPRLSVVDTLECSPLVCGSTSMSTKHDD